MNPKSDTNYYIVSENSGKCLDVSGWSTDDRARIHQWTIHGGENQQWQFIIDVEGYYEIVSKHSGKCVDDATATSEDGGIVHLYSRHSGENQKWRVKEAGDGCVFLESKIGNLCLDATWDEVDGSPIVLWSRHGGVNQKWRLIEATDHEATQTPLFVDGTNVCLWRKPIDLCITLTLLIELKKLGLPFLCIFDANTRYRMTRMDRKVYEGALKESPRVFAEVPGRTQADDFLLKRADTSQGRVITNDQFRDRKDKYVWIGSEPERLVRGAVVGEYLTIPTLEIDAAIRGTADVLWQEFNSI